MILSALTTGPEEYYGLNNMKIPKKYTTGNKKQIARMKKEIAKFKKGKGQPFFQWSGDTNPKTGKPYKTKKSAATKAFHRRYKTK